MIQSVDLCEFYSFDFGHVHFQLKSDFFVRGDIKVPFKKSQFIQWLNLQCLQTAILHTSPILIYVNDEIQKSQKLLDKLTFYVVSYAQIVIKIFQVGPAKVPEQFQACVSGH